MLVYSLPFVMSSFFIFKNKKHHFLLYCLFIGITFITLANGSRGAFISLIIIFIYYLKFNPGKFNFMRNVIPLFLLFFLSKFLIANATFITSFIIKLSYLFEDNSRLNLISKGLELLVDSYFFGVGPGNLGVHVYKRIWNDTYCTSQSFYRNTCSVWCICIYWIYNTFI